MLGSGMDSNSRFRLFSAKTANFLDFPFSVRGNPMEIGGGKGALRLRRGGPACDGLQAPYGLFEHRNSFALVEEIRSRVDLGRWPDLRIGREPVSRFMQKVPFKR
jgi:hypothetical protein